MHRLTYEYRIYPRKRQGGRLEQLLEQGREVYNAALRQCRNAFEATSTHQTAFSQWPYFRRRHWVMRSLRTSRIYPGE
ncbi:MAG: helix-turn-helix domain-containing protein [Aggregatilineales bacterium]